MQREHDAESESRNDDKGAGTPSNFKKLLNRLAEFDGRVEAFSNGPETKQTEFTDGSQEKQKSI